MTVGMMLDCGSGHSSIIWYSECQGVIRQLRRSKLRLPEGGNYKITDAFERAVPIAESAAAFAGALRAEIADARSGGIEQPDIIYVGATGGLRNMLSDGRVAPAALREFETSLLDGLSGAFGGQKSVAKFGVISGEEEAAWELAAAELIYGDARNSMFSDAKVGGFGLFSGGGSSMQVQQAAGAPRSFPFSTWCGPEMDEELGADIHAWKDADKWERWEAGLLAKIVEAKESLAVELGRGQLFSGCFLLTAMCHVAATAAGFAEAPVTAAEAVRRLAAALEQFRVGAEEPFESFVAGRHSVHPTVSAWYSSQPPHHLARVGAMHICRLKLVLSLLFDPDASLFAPPATDSNGARLDCEWTLQLFAKEAQALAAAATAPEGGDDASKGAGGGQRGLLSCFRRRRPHHDASASRKGTGTTVTV